MPDSRVPQVSTMPPSPATNPESPDRGPAAFDRDLHARQARLSAFLSPASLTLAAIDWGLHLWNAPARRLELATKAADQRLRLAQPERWTRPLPGDHRFEDPGWSQPPFDVIAQSFLLLEEWWREATQPMPGVEPHHRDVVAFAARQVLDLFSPSNYPWTNPEVLRTAAAEGGRNFARGALHAAEDLQRLARGLPPGGDAGFVPGREVACTPGKVVLRNELIELIQYRPTTGRVRPEPVLIVPAWIMKYYILDLSPRNSLVRHLVAQGFTVFCISWRNPGAAMRETSLDDYRRLGVMAALEAIARIAGPEKVHACGYCLGGTLLAIAAAAMGRDGDERLASVTLLAAQTDFTEAGELQIFTDESQLALLDDVMWRQGYLDSTQMAGAFQMLRSNELVWSRYVRAYLLGRRDGASDLMAWNADATRMPYRMHSDYLHAMFQRNDLAEGRYRVAGRPIAIQDIRAPMFAVATETDHVAPWRSVYKIHLLHRAELTFVLTSGGHNAGVVSEPGHPHRHYRIARRPDAETFLAPEEWLAANPACEGSWWSAWFDWLEQRSGAPVPPPSLGAPGERPDLGDAPGQYVFDA
jgi:polyhydroxyalkanoate synthase